MTYTQHAIHGHGPERALLQCMHLLIRSWTLRHYFVYPSYFSRQRKPTKGSSQPKSDSKQRFSVTAWLDAEPR